MGNAEFKLAAECCRLAFAGGAADAVCELAATTDWPHFVRLARFHRVQGLVWKSLSSVNAEIPDAAADSLSGDASRIAAVNLRTTVECRALLGIFEEAQIPLLFVKGLTLGTLAYGDASAKAGVDIDLLIDPRTLAASADLLRQRGYRPAEPRRVASAAALSAWHGPHKESLWRHAGLQIDLHTRLADNPRLIPDIGVHSPRQLVDVGSGIRLPTLAPDELFAYLAVHGASSAWFRLKWISDFAAFTHRIPPQDLERLYRRSQELGAGRAAAQALLLAGALFQTLENAPELKRSLERDARNRWLYRAALSQLAGREEPIEPTSRAFGTAAIHYTQFLLLPGLSYKAAEFVRQARAALASAR